MPLTKLGKRLEKQFEKEYGKDRGKTIFYKFESKHPKLRLTYK